MARTTHRYNLKNLKTHELPGALPPGPPPGPCPGPTGGLKAAPRPPAYFGLSLCVHITSRLATPLSVYSITER